MKALKALYSGECFPVVGHIVGYGGGGGVLIGFIIGMFN